MILYIQIYLKKNAYQKLFSKKWNYLIQFKLLKFLVIIMTSIYLFKYSNLNLKEFISNLFIQLCLEENSNQLKIYSLIYKRIQVLDKIQKIKNNDIYDTKKIKEKIQNYPISLLNPDITDDLKKILSNLQKSLLKSDEKKGFFSRFHRTKSESIFKILSKEVDILSFETVDVSPIRYYFFFIIF
jgi:hypothetical protein